MLKHTRKKTIDYIDQLLFVYKQEKRNIFAVQQRLLRYIPDDGIVPEGYAALLNGRIICPKKRGEKIRVVYLTRREEEL